MVRRWLHDSEPVNYVENLGHIDHCACFPRTQSQITYVEGEILTIPPTQLVRAVVYYFRTFADRRSLRAPYHTQPGKQIGMSSNGSEVGTKLLVPAYLSLSEAPYRSHNHCLQPPPNGQEQEDEETAPDHPRCPAC